jgi:hypothetical protein
MDLMPVLTIQGLKEVAFFDPSNFWDLLIRFLFNLGITVLIARYIYYRKTRRKDYLFTFLLINSMVFLLAYLLSDVELKLGFAFGLFALFGILRYRTNPVQIKEMTYLFVVIGIAVINSVSDRYVSYAEVLFANFLITAILWFLEFYFLLSHESSRRIVYERIELVNPARQKELIDDLSDRTGIRIHRTDVVSVNFLKKRAEIIIYYYDKNKVFNAGDDFYPGRTV